MGRKLFKPSTVSLAAKSANNNADAQSDGNMSQLDPQMRKCIEGYNQINSFLAAFINRDIPDCDYEVRDRPLIEKLMDMEFVDSSDTRGIFYNDDSHSFDKVLL